MTTSLPIDERLMKELVAQAERESLPIQEFVERTIRRGLSAGEAAPVRQRFVQRTYAMGQPKVPLDKALSLAAELDDEETIRKMTDRETRRR